MLFTETESKVITNTLDIVLGPGSKQHIRNGLVADKYDKVGLRDLRKCVEDLASQCTAMLIESDDNTPELDAVRVYNAVHTQILIKIDTALDDPSLSDFYFFDHPLWDKM